MNDETKNRLAAMDARKVERAARKAQMEEYQAWQEAARMAAEFAEEIKTETKMTEEPKKGQWRECEILGVRHLVWVPPPGSVKEGQPFPFCAFPADESEAAKKKWPFGPTEDDIWRKDYEAARAFAWHAHGLLSMCEKYEAMLAVCGSRLLEPEARALEALDKLRENIHTLTDLKIKKLPHRDAVFMSQPKPYGDV